MTKGQPINNGLKYNVIRHVDSLGHRVKLEPDIVPLSSWEGHHVDPREDTKRRFSLKTLYSKVIKLSQFSQTRLPISDLFEPRSTRYKVRELYPNVSKSYNEKKNFNFNNEDRRHIRLKISNQLKIRM